MRLELRVLPPFPTRRSSDLRLCVVVPRATGRGGDRIVASEDLLGNALDRTLLRDLQHRDDRQQGGREEQPAAVGPDAGKDPDRKSTRLNSSHLGISYAVFCL